MSNSKSKFAVFSTVSQPYYYYEIYFKRDIHHMGCEQRMWIRFRWLICLALVLHLDVAAQQDSLPKGYTIFRYPNGVISSEGRMVEGRPDGFWKTYYEDGTLKSAGNRENYQLSGEWVFYRNDSTLQQKINYEQDLRQGLAFNFDGEGNMIEELTYLTDTLQGEARYFYASGELYRTVIFVMAKNRRGSEYAKDGRIITLLDTTGLLAQHRN